MSRTALELIGQSGFGYSFDGLTEDCVPHPFADAVKRLEWVYYASLFNCMWLTSDPSGLIKRLLFARVFLLPTLYKIGTPKLQRFMLGLLPWQVTQEVVRHVDFIYNSSVDIVKTRKAALQASKEEMDGHVGRGKDIISTLCQIPHYLSLHPLIKK